MIVAPHIVELSIILFLFYWLVGGVLFAIVGLLRPIKIRKAQFSCLFTLSSLLVAIGAAFSGTAIAGRPIARCLERADGYFDSLAAVISCGVLPLSLATFVGFILLILLGSLLMLLSLSKNQSWIDERSPEEPPMPGVITPVESTIDSPWPGHQSGE